MGIDISKNETQTMSTFTFNLTILVQMALELRSVEHVLEKRIPKNELDMVWKILYGGILPYVILP